MAAPTILIVDDEANQRLLIGQALIALGHDCRFLQASSAAEALRHVDANVVNLIITDYQMPSMTGLELVALLRARDDTTPVIMISAYNLDDVRARAQALRIDHILVKPFPIERLRRAASIALGSG